MSCKVDAIFLKYDKSNNIYPVIDKKKCIGCKQCEKFCPMLNQSKKNKIIKCYAGYNMNEEDRKNAASGGIATSIYRYAIKKSILFNGVVLDKKNFEAHHQLGNSEIDLVKFRNSKYTFSFMDDIVVLISENIRQNMETIFIGLPCQCAAVKRYCINLNLNIEKLMLIDIVCHGVPSPKYLEEHISSVFLKKEINNIFFRDPLKGTSNFIFSIYGKDKTYSKKVESNDNYQIGYHNATIYRENCYQCIYATNDRIGDLTICDYPSLGKIKEYKNAKDEIKKGISCIIVNSKKGEILINKLYEEGYIYIAERPIEEILKYEKQLNFPSQPSKFRVKFLENIENMNFTQTCNKIFYLEKIKYPLIRKVKDIIKSVMNIK